jgi:hypothetical protein
MEHDCREIAFHGMGLWVGEGNVLYDFGAAGIILEKCLWGKVFYILVLIVDVPGSPGAVNQYPPLSLHDRVPCMVIRAIGGFCLSLDHDGSQSSFRSNTVEKIGITRTECPSEPQDVFDGL